MPPSRGNFFSVLCLVVVCECSGRKLLNEGFLPKRKRELSGLEVFLGEKSSSETSREGNFGMNVIITAPPSVLEILVSSNKKKSNFHSLKDKTNHMAFNFTHLRKDSTENLSRRNKSDIPNRRKDNSFKSTPRTPQKSAKVQLTPDKLTYIIIGSCCILGVLCLILVVLAMQCRLGKLRKKSMKERMYRKYFQLCTCHLSHDCYQCYMNSIHNCRSAWHTRIPPNVRHPGSTYSHPQGRGTRKLPYTTLPVHSNESGEYFRNPVTQMPSTYRNFYLTPYRPVYSSSIGNNSTFPSSFCNPKRTRGSSLLPIAPENDRWMDCGYFVEELHQCHGRRT